MTDCSGHEDSLGSRTLFRANTEEALKGESVMKSVIREGEPLSGSATSFLQFATTLKQGVFSLTIGQAGQQIECTSQALFEESVLKMGVGWGVLCAKAPTQERPMETESASPFGVVLCSEAGYVLPCQLLCLKLPPRTSLQNQLV